MDGILYLTNWTDRDFVTMWDGNEYTFPALKKTPVIIGSPEENQNIRKLFARKLCEREIFDGREWKANEKQGRKDGTAVAGTYQEADLIDMMQKCLSDLEVGMPTIRQVRKSKRDDRITPIDELESSGKLASVA